MAGLWVCLALPSRPQAPVGVAGGLSPVRGPSGSSMGCGLLASPICHSGAWQELAFVPPYFYDKLKAELPGTQAPWLNCRASVWRTLYFQALGWGGTNPRPLLILPKHSVLKPHPEWQAALSPALVQRKVLSQLGRQSFREFLLKAGPSLAE